MSNIYANDVGGERDAVTNLRAPTHVRPSPLLSSRTKARNAVRPSELGPYLPVDRGEASCDRDGRLLLWSAFVFASFCARELMGAEAEGTGLGVAQDV